MAITPWFIMGILCYHVGLWNTKIFTICLSPTYNVYWIRGNSERPQLSPDSSPAGIHACQKPRLREELSPPIVCETYFWHLDLRVWSPHKPLQHTHERKLPSRPECPMMSPRSYLKHCSDKPRASATISWEKEQMVVRFDRGMRNQWETMQRDVKCWHIQVQRAITAITKPWTS